MNIDQYYSYSLNKSSSYSCSLNKRKAKEAYDLTMKWLENFSDKIIDNKIKCNLTIEVNQFGMKKSVEDIFKFHGVFSEIGSIRTFPEEIVSHNIYQFESDFNSILDLLELYEKNKSLLDKVEFSIKFAGEFILNVLQSHIININPKTPKSNFMVSLSKSSIIYPEINFPFADYNIFLYYYNNLKNHFPFKPNDRNIRKHIKRKDSDEYYIRKIP